MLARASGPHSFDSTLDYDFVSLAESSAIHSFLLGAAEDSGRYLRVRVEVSNFETACRLIAAQVGIGVIPETAALRYVQVLPLKITYLSDEWALRQLHICIPKATDLPVFSQELVNVLVHDAAQASLDETQQT